jgi:pyridoxal phosphate enzyme (YggS family)
MLISEFNSLRASLNGVALVAVSKRQSTDAIQTLYNYGQHDFAENYLQEGVAKIQALSALPDITWHFIGQIQSNKTRRIAQYFNWVQSVDRLSIAQRLNQHCLELNKTLNICIAVNMDQEPQKSGVLPDEVAALLAAVSALPALHCRGLMVIPRARQTANEQRAIFMKVRALYDALKQQGFLLDTLSMGMSQDYQVAIEAGSTMVRLGTKLFGLRG